YTNSQAKTVAGQLGYQLTNKDLGGDTLNNVWTFENTGKDPPYIQADKAGHASQWKGFNRHGARMGSYVENINSAGKLILVKLRD
ncbi:unnamed protein product, partial [Didymodactylos carnosus]